MSYAKNFPPENIPPTKVRGGRKKFVKRWYFADRPQNRKYLKRWPLISKTASAVPYSTGGTVANLMSVRMSGTSESESSDSEFGEPGVSERRHTVQRFSLHLTLEGEVDKEEQLR